MFKHVYITTDRIHSTAASIDPSIGHSPIGILDSGVGGLSVMRHVQTLLPQEDLLYVADQAHVPYGQRPVDEIRHFSEAITRFLLTQRAKLVVVACNTASAAALGRLRETFPTLPIVGMEPAVKPGATGTGNGRIGVLATAGTFHSRRYASLMDRFAQSLIVFEDPCNGLVEEIEAGNLETPETERILREALGPMLDGGVDTVVLGCTHYPFVLPLIRRLVGPDVKVIDPAPAVARQVQRVLEQKNFGPDAGLRGRVAAYTTGDTSLFSAAAEKLLDHPLAVYAAVWRGKGPSKESSNG
jgi:glutamate racemase